MIPILTSASVGLSVISLTSEDLAKLECPACENSLEFHQPDPSLPDRMLWTCEHCRTWFLMDFMASSSEAVLVCLPGGDFFLKAIGR